MAKSLMRRNVILLIAVTIPTEIRFHIHVMIDDVSMKLHAEEMARGFLKHQPVMIIVRAYRIMLF